MSTVSVIGGVYGEECAFPLRKQVFGSAGRVAAAISPHFDTVTLHTVLSDQAASKALRAAKKSVTSALMNDTVCLASTRKD